MYVGKYDFNLVNRVFLIIMQMGEVDMYINEAKLKVRYVETDQMGIVHHSNYYAWFEVGRGEYITEKGILNL